MLHTLTKGWYLCCYKYQHNKIIMHIKIFILVKPAFFLEEIQQSSKNKTGILMKLAKDLVIIASSLWTRY